MDKTERRTQKNKYYPIQSAGEARTNYFASWCLNAAALVCLIVWVLCLTAVIDVDGVYSTLVLAPTALLLLLPALIRMRVRRHYIGIKYLYFGLSALAAFSLSSCISYASVFFWVFPILLSCQYFNYRFTLDTILICELLIVGSFYLGLFFGLWDANILGNEEAMLAFSGTRVDFIQTNPNNLLGKATLIGLLPRLILFVVASPLCLFISYRMRELLDSLSVTERERAARATEAAVKQTESDIACGIRNGVLPDLFLLPTRGEFGVTAEMLSAADRCADFYDCFLLSENRLCVLIGDAHGGGLNGAMQVSRLQSMLKHFLLVTKSAAAAINSVNKQLVAENSSPVCAWVGIISLRSGECECASGGDCGAVIIRADGNAEAARVSHNERLGESERTVYKSSRLDINRGDRLMLFSDGVYKATDTQGEELGGKRLLELINAFKGGTLIGRLLNALDDYCGGELGDDATVLVFERAEKNFEEI